MNIHKKLKKNFKRSISCLSDYFRDDQIFGFFFRKYVEIFYRVLYAVGNTAISLSFELRVLFFKVT